MLFNNNQKDPSKISFDRIRSFIYKVIKKRVPNRDDAEDLTHDVILRGLGSQQRNADRLNFENEEAYLRYFTTIALHEIKRFFAQQNKVKILRDVEELLANLPNGQLGLDRGLEIAQTICQLPLKQRLALFLGERMLIISFLRIFSIETIADLMAINVNLLRKLADEIPLDEDDIKYVIEAMLNKNMKTTVRNERYRGRKDLEGNI